MNFVREWLGSRKAKNYREHGECSESTQEDPQHQISIEELLRSTGAKVAKNMHLVNELVADTRSEQILEPYKYLLESGGKRIRLGMAVIICQLFCREIPPEIYKVGGLIQFLHCATLILDDIEDKSELRRGAKCSHLIYGLGPAINSANYVYFLPFKNLLKCATLQQKRQLLLIYGQEMTTAHLGQAEDILVHKLCHLEELPELEAYYRMTSAKTGSLMRMLVQMVAVFLGVSGPVVEQLVQIMTDVGISFQITDDALNLSTRAGKGIIAEDLRQKKFTIIIHLLRDCSEFMQLFIQQKKSQETIAKMLDIIENHKCISASLTIANQFAERAIMRARKLETKYSSVNFTTLIRYIVERKA